MSVVSVISSKGARAINLSILDFKLVLTYLANSKISFYKSIHIGF